MLLEGKRGIVFGVANKRSIAWAIARAAAAEGARMAFNFQGEKLEEKVKELAETIPDKTALVAPCDVTRDEELDRFFGEAARALGGPLDFLVHCIAFANREELSGAFVDVSRAGFLLAQEVSAFSLPSLCKRAAPLMEKGGSVVALTYLGSERVVPNYNVMGVAKASLEASIRYLPLFPDEPGAVFHEALLLESPNALRDVSPRDAALADVVRVIDVKAVRPGRSLELVMDGEAQQALCYLK